MAATELIPSDLERLDKLENLLFVKRETMEVIWLGIGAILNEVVRDKLYRLKQDENGNYFRSMGPYLADLEHRFRERGLNMGQTTLNRFLGNYRLYMEEMGLSEDDMLLIGKTNLDRLAPAVRKLQKEQGEESAKALVNDILAAAQANNGLPTYEVDEAIDEATGRIMKGMEVEFVDGIFGRRLKRLMLWWGSSPIDLMKQEISEEQAQWVMKRLGIKPS